MLRDFGEAACLNLMAIVWWSHVGLKLSEGAAIVQIWWLQVHFWADQTHMDTTKMKVLKCSLKSSLSAHTYVQKIPIGKVPHIYGHFYVHIFVALMIIDDLPESWHWRTLGFMT